MILTRVLPWGNIWCGLVPCVHRQEVLQLHWDCSRLWFLICDVLRWAEPDLDWLYCKSQCSLPSDFIWWGQDLSRKLNICSHEWLEEIAFSQKYFLIVLRFSSSLKYMLSCWENSISDPSNTEDRPLSVVFSLVKSLSCTSGCGRTLLARQKAAEAMVSAWACKEPATFVSSFWSVRVPLKMKFKKWFLWQQCGFIFCWCNCSCTYTVSCITEQIDLFENKDKRESNGFKLESVLWFGSPRRPVRNCQHRWAERQTGIIGLINPELPGLVFLFGCCCFAKKYLGRIVWVTVNMLILISTAEKAATGNRKSLNRANLGVCC